MTPAPGRVADLDVRAPAPLPPTRWPWWGAAGLLTAAAVLTARSLQLHWLPCRGTVLEALVMTPWRELDLSEACLRRMDTGLPFPYPAEPAEQVPWATELGVLAVALAALAWVLVVPTLRWSARSVVVALLPAAASLVLAAQGLVAARTPGRGDEASLPAWLWVSPEALAVLAVVLLLRWQPELRGLVLLRVVVLLQAATAFGLLHGAADYISMTAVSAANWDVPPGTGSATAAGLLVSALATAALTHPADRLRTARTWPRPGEAS